VSIVFRPSRCPSEEILQMQQSQLPSTRLLPKTVYACVEVSKAKSRSSAEAANLNPTWSEASSNIRAIWQGLVIGDFIQGPTMGSLEGLSHPPSIGVKIRPPGRPIVATLAIDLVELARFCAEHGVTDSDLLIAQILVPFETRPGEAAKMPTNASCAPWRETMTMGAKAKRRCRILLSHNSEVTHRPSRSSSSATLMRTSRKSRAARKSSG